MGGWRGKAERGMWWWMPLLWSAMWLIPDAETKDGPTAHLIAGGTKFGIMIGAMLLATFAGEFLLKRKARKMSGDEDERAVVVGYRAKDTTLGSDVGMLCAEEGWLHFRGERTEWCLRVPDVRRHDHEIRLLDHDRTLTLRPIENDLKAVFDDWESARPPAQPSTLPPLVAAPEVAERIPKVLYIVFPAVGVGFGLWCAVWMRQPLPGLFFGSLPFIAIAVSRAVERSHRKSLAEIGALALPETAGKGVP